MGNGMRCAVCEELMELMDTCEACLRLAWEPPMTQKRTGRPPFSCVNGVCMRGHQMIKSGTRWRCRQCECMYKEAKRLRVKALKSNAKP